MATMAIGRAGARNAGILAVQILALANPVLAERLNAYRVKLAEEVEAKDRMLQTAGESQPAA